eukprot:627152-Amphidinium_carterae.2
MPLRTSKQPGCRYESCQRAALGAILWVVTRIRPDLAWSHRMCATSLVFEPMTCLSRIRQLFEELALQMSPSDDGLAVYIAEGENHADLLIEYGSASLTWRSHNQSTGEAELYTCGEELEAFHAAKLFLLQFG